MWGHTASKTLPLTTISEKFFQKVECVGIWKRLKFMLSVFFIILYNNEVIDKLIINSDGNI